PLTLVTEVGGAQDRLALDGLEQTLRQTDGVADVTPVVLNEDSDTALLTVVPTSSPQSEETSALVDRLRSDVLPRAEAGTGLDLQVGGVTAAYDDFA
ncbi:MMPL family transporter, partial [Streptomyces fulvissimus]|nr:MMPL family transporter [Streptomyces microflavus]